MKMPELLKALAPAWLGRDKLETLSKAEAEILKAAATRRTVARDMSRSYDDAGGFGGRLADSITGWAGSWTFIILFLSGLALWALINSEFLGSDAFDPYPYIFLNLVLSMLAAIQAPVILMAANRQAARDRIDARHDYEVNLKAELEIMALHERLETMRTVNIERLELLALENAERMKRVEALLAAR